LSEHDSKGECAERDVTYKLGDLVMLSTKNMRHGGPGVKKLRPMYMGPFGVDYMVDKVAVKPHLPQDWSRIHNVFHVSLTKPLICDLESHGGKAVTPPPPVQWLEGEPLYEVERILDHQVANKDAWSTAS